MSGTVHIHPVYASVAWAWTILLFFFLVINLMKCSPLRTAYWHGQPDAGTEQYEMLHYYYYYYYYYYY
jgi:hypothetical protein